MRAKAELLMSAMLLALACAMMAYADGPGYKCQGSYNCKMVNCYNAGNEGYSCGLVTAVTHPMCEFTGLKADACTTVSRKCALVTYYNGAPCDNNNAPYCDLDFPTGVTKNLFEDGCNP